MGVERRLFVRAETKHLVVANNERDTCNPVNGLYNSLLSSAPIALAGQQNR